MYKENYLKTSIDSKLLELYEAEHKAIHTYLAYKILEGIVSMNPAKKHELYCDVIDAHDAVTKELYKDEHS